MYQHLLVETDGPFTTITLNRPDSLNAWTSSMAGEIRDAAARLARRFRAVFVPACPQ